MNEFDMWENKLIEKLNNSSTVKNNKLSIIPSNEGLGLEVIKAEDNKIFIAVGNYKVFFNKIAFNSYSYNKSLIDANNYVIGLINNWLNL